MEQRNFEPLIILMASGIFLLLLSGSVMHVFLGKPASAGLSNIIPDTTANNTVPTIVSEDSLQALLTDNDTISSMFTGLDSFYQAAQQVQTDHSLLHIAYFGDSMIEGDLVTQPLRRNMQRKFGGSGIGFVPVTSPLPGFRTTIRQSFSSNWHVSSFVHPGNDEGAYPGISGYVYLSEEGAETKYESAKGNALFHSAEILYGGKNIISLEVITDTTSSLVSLTPASAVSSFTVFRDSAFSLFEISVRSIEPGVLYG
ncbi:MAG: hypothetical protein NTW16_10890, partial [Bacteroidetes bacterium]|nr:hypothetical protein [Bacteroidota bacterium]